MLDGKGKGNIDLQAPKKRKGLPGVASYLAKYFSKTVDEVGPGQRRFRRSEGLEMPRTINEAALSQGRSMTDWLKRMFGCRGWRDFHVVRIDRETPGEQDDQGNPIKHFIGFWVTSWPNGGNVISGDQSGCRPDSDDLAMQG
ncbi:MAG: hypothetical protein Alpg2KO_10910 [Alphaproteobacteria bacterium]